MGQQELNSVLQSLAQAHQARVQNAQLQAVAQMNQARQDAEDKRLQLEGERLKDEHENHQQLLDTTKSLRKLQLQEDLQALQHQVETNNTLPPGSNFTPGGSFEQGGAIKLPAVYNDENNNPSILNIDPMAVRAKRIADYNTILNQPKADAAKSLDQQKAQERLEQLQSVQNEMNERAKDRDATMRAIASGVQSTREAIAALGKGVGVSDVDPATIAEQTHGLLTGKYTREQIKSEYSGKLAPIAMQIINGASKIGTPVTNKQAQDISDLSSRVSNIPLVDGAIDNLPSTFGALVNGIPGTNKDFKSATSQLQANLPKTSIAASGSKRLNSMELGLIGGGYIPSAMTPKDQAIKNRDATYNALNKAAEDIIPDASEAQKALIKNEVGLSSLHPYGDQKLLQDSMSKINSVMAPTPPPQPPQPPQQ